MSDSGDGSSSLGTTDTRSSSSGEHGDECKKPILGNGESEIGSGWAELCLGPEGDVSHHNDETHTLHPYPYTYPHASTITSYGYTDVTRSIKEESCEEEMRKGLTELGYVALGQMGRTELLRVKKKGKGREEPGKIFRFATAKMTRSESEVEMLRGARVSRGGEAFPLLLHALPLSPQRNLLLLESAHCSLQDMIDSHARQGRGYHANWVRMILSGLAAALEYLHVREFAHHSLRLDHILLGKQPTLIKLCGLSGLVDCGKGALDPTLPHPLPPPTHLLYWAPEMIPPLPSNNIARPRPLRPTRPAATVSSRNPDSPIMESLNQEK